MLRRNSADLCIGIQPRTPSPTSEFYIPFKGKIDNVRIYNRALTQSEIQQLYMQQTRASLTIIKSGTGTGIVTSSPTGINCGSDCSEIFPIGMTISLTAIADLGSKFSGWSGIECSNIETCNITINEDIKITASFGKDLHSLSGTVKAGDNTAIQNVAMALTGASSKSTSTDASGLYRFQDLMSGVYTLTPTKDQYFFSPSSRSVNINGSDIADQDFIGTPASPVANFTASPIKGIAPLPVSFTDSSIGTVTSWLWNFGDSGSSTDKYPSHTYAKPGTYTVSLTVTGPGGTDTKTRDRYIAVSTSNNNFKASGRVTMVNGHSVAGKTIIFSASGKDVMVPASVQTDQDGRWGQEGFQKNVIYDIQPQHAGYSYSPSSRRYKAVESRSDLDFQIVSFTVSGKALTPRLIPIPGVVISFSVVSGKGSTPSAVKTGKDGNWSRMGFDPSTIYKASPTKKKYRFHPIVIQFGGPTKNCDFEGSLKSK